MNLAGYIRVSTEGQVDAFGKDVQIEGIKRWAGMNGHVITQWFEEDAVSGKIEGGDRPQMKEIVARADEFQGVVAFDSTRFARRLVVQETLYGLLWKSGLRIFTAAAGEVDEDDDPTRILIRQVLGILAEFDHRSVVKRLQSGRKQKLDRGGYAGGTPAFGFKVVGSGKYAELMEDEMEAKTVEMIKGWYANGAPLRTIADRLNALNIPTKRGGEWSATQVSRIVKRNGQ